MELRVSKIISIVFILAVSCTKAAPTCDCTSLPQLQPNEQSCLLGHLIQIITQLINSQPKPIQLPECVKQMCSGTQSKDVNITKICTKEDPLINVGDAVVKPPEKKINPIKNEEIFILPLDYSLTTDFITTNKPLQEDDSGKTESSIMEILGEANAGFTESSSQHKDHTTDGSSGSQNEFSTLFPFEENSATSTQPNFGIDVTTDDILHSSKDNPFSMTDYYATILPTAEDSDTITQPNFEIDVTTDGGVQNKNDQSSGSYYHATEENSATTTDAKVATTEDTMISGSYHGTTLSPIEENSATTTEITTDNILSSKHVVDSLDLSLSEPKNDNSPTDPTTVGSNFDTTTTNLNIADPQNKVIIPTTLPYEETTTFKEYYEDHDITLDGLPHYYPGDYFQSSETTINYQIAEPNHKEHDPIVSDDLKTTTTPSNILTETALPMSQTDIETEVANESTTTESSTNHDFLITEALPLFNTDEVSDSTTCAPIPTPTVSISENTDKSKCDTDIKETVKDIVTVVAEDASKKIDSQAGGQNKSHCGTSTEPTLETCNSDGVVASSEEASCEDHPQAFFIPVLKLDSNTCLTASELKEFLFKAFSCPQKTKKKTKSHKCQTKIS